MSEFDEVDVVAGEEDDIDVAKKISDEDEDEFDLAGLPEDEDDIDIYASLGEEVDSTY